METQRSALIVANYEFTDPGLKMLRAPAHDAEALAEVLGDAEIGNFSVRTVVNRPSHEVDMAIESFFADRGPDDLLVLHFSGHGVKDQNGDLYFAAPDTDLRLLGATAVSADFVNRLMSRTRSRRVVLFLDCCYAGAFERGLGTRGDTEMHLAERLGGRGRAVITASTAMEYAFEGTELTGAAASQPSVFTSALVEALRTGDADTDQDGLIGLDELYEYVYDKVRSVTPSQTPSKWALGFQGELYLAKRSSPVTTPSPLPTGLDDALQSPFAGVRAGAITELRRILAGSHAGLALAARLALERLADDDSRSVAEAASLALAGAGPTPSATVSEEHGTAGPTGGEPAGAESAGARTRAGHTGATPAPSSDAAERSMLSVQDGEEGTAAGPPSSAATSDAATANAAPTEAAPAEAATTEAATTEAATTEAVSREAARTEAALTDAAAANGAPANGAPAEVAESEGSSSAVGAPPVIPSQVTPSDAAAAAEGMAGTGADAVRTPDTGSTKVEPSESGQDADDTDARRRTAPPPPPGRRRILALAVGACVLLALLGWGLSRLVDGGGGNNTGGSVPTVPDGSIVVAVKPSGAEPELRVVDTTSGDSTVLSGAKVPTLPTVSPDRKTIAYQSNTAGTATLRVIDADGTHDRELLGASSGCRTPGRPAWNEDGTRLAVVCNGDDPPRLLLLDADGQVLRDLDAGGYPLGSTTWARSDGRDLVIFMRREQPDGPTSLWYVDPGRPHAEPQRLTSPPEGRSDTHPDASDQALLFLRGGPNPKVDLGDVWVKTAADAPETPVRRLTSVASPAWSPDGSSICFLSGKSLWTASADGSHPQLVLGESMHPGPPAWGSR